MLNPQTVAEARQARWLDLAVRCEACGHEGHVAWDRFPPTARIAALADRLRCSACRARRPACWPWMDPIELRRLQRLVRS